MHLSDEDNFNVDSLPNLKNFLNKKNPDIIVTNYFIQDKAKKLKPYRINSTRIIKPKEFLNCSHNPGIIWHVERVKKYANTEWNRWRVDYNLISKYYPHTLLMVKLFPNLCSWFYGEMVCFQEDSYRHQHFRDENGDYSDLTPRWIQFNELTNFITMEKKYESCKSGLHYESMLETHKLSLFSVIRVAISNRQDYLTYFDRAVKRSLLIDNRLWVSRFIRAFFHPILMAKKIKLWLAWKGN